MRTDIELDFSSGLYFAIEKGRFNFNFPHKYPIAQPQHSAVNYNVFQLALPFLHLSVCLVMKELKH